MNIQHTQNQNVSEAFTNAALSLAVFTVAVLLTVTQVFSII